MVAGDSPALTNQEMAVARDHTNAECERALQGRKNGGHLTLHHALERIEKSGIRNHRRLRAPNPRLPFRPQRRHCKRHGDAVIAQRIDLRAVQFLFPGNLQSIIPFFHLRSHGAKVGGDGGNPVRLLHPQLARIANLHSAVV